VSFTAGQFAWYLALNEPPAPLQKKNQMVQAWVVQKVDNSIHWINHYPADSMVCFVKTYPLDSDLSGG